MKKGTNLATLKIIRITTIISVRHGVKIDFTCRRKNDFVWEMGTMAMTLKRREGQGVKQSLKNQIRLERQRDDSGRVDLIVCCRIFFTVHVLQETEKDYWKRISSNQFFSIVKIVSILFTSKSAHVKGDNTVKHPLQFLCNSFNMLRMKWNFLLRPII